MPRKGGELTVREQDFITAYIETGFNRELAEKRAGYSSTGGYQVLRRPDVQREIDSRIEADYAECEAIVIRRMLMLARDEKTPPAMILKIADQTGRRRNAFASAGAATLQKEPHEMTAEEIAAQLEALQHAAASKARPVNQDEPDPTSPFD